MKKHGWPELMHDYIHAAHSCEFAYGTFDCALFCADWVQIATGVDHARDLRGYTSMKAAYEIIAKFDTLAGLVSHQMGTDTVHPAFLQRGDIVLMCDSPALGDAPEGLGICLGLHSAFPAQKGIIMLRTLDATCGWKVG